MIYYSYLWLREKDGTFPKGVPYYVGKGTGKRAFVKHIFEKKVFSPPKDKANIVIFPMLNEEEAFESEIAIIELLGLIVDGTGCLRNLTKGGRRGIRTSKSNMKCSQTLLGHEVSPEVRIKISTTLKGKSYPKPSRKGCIPWNKGKKFPGKISPTSFKPGHISAPWTPERRARFIELRKTWSVYPKAV